MKKFLLPIVLMLIGSGAGVGAGIFLRPAPAEMAADAKTETPAKPAPKNTGKGVKSEEGVVEYLKMNNQFVVPVVRDGEVTSLVVMALSLEIPSGTKEAVYRKEPKLRDSFLQVLFDHANVGGFDGAFTDAGMLSGLRRALHEVAQRDIGRESVSDVLIVEIARQDY